MIQTLELAQFRSYRNGLFGFEDGVNIIVGANASGKTNLLEALHVIAMAHGFRHTDKELLQHDTEWARLEALTTDGTRVVKLQKDVSPLLEIDGVVKRRLTNETQLPVVIFEPDHMLLLALEPERRRSYLDGILQQTVPGYKQELTACKRALAQRNRLLKQSNTTPDQLFVWDVQFAQKSGIIAKHRQELVTQLHQMSEPHYQKISSTQARLSLTYQTKLDPDNYTESLLHYLRTHSDVDHLRGYTTAGAHRDDVFISLNGKDAKTSASRGETRSIILALKIVELEIVHTLRARRPLLLLDDVFSELDGSRRRALAEALAAYQTFLTTTDADVAVDHFSTYNIIPMG